MSFSDIINQEKAKEVLTAQLKSKRIAHAYLFLGPEGVGRKKTALEFAKVLNCRGSDGISSCGHCVSCMKIDHGNHPDVQCIDFAWQANLENKELEKQKAIKIDTIRALQKDINLKPTEGTWKVYIIDPAEKITLDAANSLLKTLEEPPAWTVIILCAKYRENLPATIVSRAQIVRFTPLPEAAIASFLETKLSAGRDRAFDAARKSEGSLSQAVRIAEEPAASAASVWRRIRSRETTTDELLSLSQEYGKQAAEVVAELLYEAKDDFRARPAAFASSIETILASQRLLERNVNPQMVLDVLFLKLHSLD